MHNFGFWGLSNTGGHAYSRDAITWYPTSLHAYIDDIIVVNTGLTYHRVFQSRAAYSSSVQLWDNDARNSSHTRTFYRQERPFLLFDQTSSQPIALFTGIYAYALPSL